MMNTPICDFIANYIKKAPWRLHMPGHKGLSLLGAEPYDITEIDGADSLYEASGIIRESEDNATALFGSRATCYSTEGSSQCIRAMLFLAQLHAKKEGKKPLILAARNAHKTFVTAVGLLDLDVEWLTPRAQASYLSCPIDRDQLQEALEQYAPAAVYLTSPDYLGNCADIATAASLCHRYGALLLVDNAHGSYLKFLQPSRHPLDLGADLCCDSAHKTLPALTGSAYLHVSASAPDWMEHEAKRALALFGSTSPSYLILQSLDAVNAYLANGYAEKLSRFVSSVETLKQRLSQHGYSLVGDEPLKLTLSTKPYGYIGHQFARELQKQKIVCEFCDPDFVVLMLSPELDAEAMSALFAALINIPKKAPLKALPPQISSLPRVCSIREALLADRETVAPSQAEGRVLASLSLSCPPAVPIAVCGERLDACAVEAFAYYGIETCDVLKETL